MFARVTWFQGSADNVEQRIVGAKQAGTDCYRTSPDYLGLAMLVDMTGSGGCFEWIGSV